jgi:F-type H+-transporting ATPase subunit b
MAEPLPEVFETRPAETFEAEAQGAEVHHVEPTLLGLEPFQWVAVAMAVLLLIAIFGAKVHKTIAGGLDGKIAAIRQQLDEAKKLRAEAEALRAEYVTKIAGAEKDAEAMLANARHEADAIVAKAEADTAALIARRERMAQDKISAAERAALDELRVRAAEASTAAAARLIRERHEETADRRLADRMIAEI